MAELFTTSIFSDPNLKAYYRFSSGALTTDSTANAHTLTAISDPAETTGKYGGGVDLDSGDAYSTTSGADFQLTGNFSMGCWVKNAAVNNVLLQSYSANTNIAGLQLYLDSSFQPNLIMGKNTGTVINTDYKNLASSIAVNDGNWHLVVATWDGSTIRIYVDNNSAASVAWADAAAFAATNYVRIGCGNDTGTDVSFMAGQMDEAFFLKGTVLSAANVLTLYTDPAVGGGFLTNFI